MLTANYDRLGLAAGETVLDLGCGFGRHAYEALRRNAHVVACDLGLDELRQVRSIGAAMRADGELSDQVVLETANGDATMLPFADGSFDRIIASEVMEHIDDDEGDAKKIWFLLDRKKNGLIGLDDFNPRAAEIPSIIQNKSTRSFDYCLPGFSRRIQ